MPYFLCCCLLLISAAQNLPIIYVARCFSTPLYMGIRRIPNAVAKVLVLIRGVAKRPISKLTLRIRKLFLRLTHSISRLSLNPLPRLGRLPCLKALAIFLRLLKTGNSFRKKSDGGKMIFAFFIVFTGFDCDYFSLKRNHVHRI